MKLERRAPLRLPPHPERAAGESWRQWALRESRPRAIDLFSGCGGLSLGLEAAGFRVVLSVDHDEWCLETHRHNFAGAALGMDLSDPERVEGLISLLSGIPLDLVAGGPPCQPFSRAGRPKIRSLVAQGVRDAVDSRRELWQAFVRVVEALRPRAVLLENVPDMALGDELVRLRTILSRLEAAGYSADASLLDAYRYGVPQHRQRLFLVATLGGGRFKWPRERPQATVADAIGDLPELGEGCGSFEMTYDGPPQSGLQRWARRGLNGARRLVWDHVTRPVRADDRLAFTMMTPATRYSDLPEELRRYRADIFDDKYHRLGWGDVSRSITAHIAKDGYWYIHPGEARTLTVREAARIQTFPDRFRFAGTRSHQFTQIGNAVPPLLGEALGRAVLRALEAGPVAAAEQGTTQLRRLRERLRAWGASDAASAPWRHPGDAWSVVVGTVLDPRPPAGEDLVRSFLDAFPTPQSLDRSRLGVFARDLPAPVRSRVERLVRVSASTGATPSRGDWLPSGAVGAGERALVSAVGLGEDMVLASTPGLRVMSRLTGIAGYEQRRLSEGRLALGRLVGTEHVAELNAALHALGSIVCRADRAHCEECPLSDECVSVTLGRRRRAR